MKAVCISLAIAGAALSFTADSASSGSILMSTDGYYIDNAQKAGALGHTVTTASLTQISLMSQSDLAGYSAVFVSPGFGSIGYNSLRTAVAGGGSLQLYVASGGNLALNVAGNYGDQPDIAPGGVDFDRDPLHNSETVMAPSHPYITGVGYGGHQLTASDFDDWIQTDHGQVLGIGTNGTIVLSNEDGTSVLAYNHGSGQVLVSSLTIGWAEGGEARGTAQDNMINYIVEVPEPASFFVLLIGAAVVGRRRRGC